MEYEVEKRTKGKLELPQGTELVKKYRHIKDIYFLFPNPMLRVRHAELSFPVQRNEGYVCMKRFDDKGNIEESETTVGDPACLEQIFKYIHGKPAVVVEGSREVHRFGKATINLDHIVGIGDYTEVEVLTDSLEETGKALEEVERIFKLMDVCPRALTTKIYPEMIYGEFSPLEIPTIVSPS